MPQSENKEKLVLSVAELREMLERAESQGRRRSAFQLGRHFNSENIVEIAKSQFPRLEAKVAIREMMEHTKRLLIIVAAVCLVAGAALVVFAPEGKEGVSYAIAAVLAILPLGAIGVQEFRIRSVALTIEGGTTAVTEDPGQ